MKEVDEQTAKVAVQAFGRDTPVDDLALGQIELVPTGGKALRRATKMMTRGR